MNSKCQEKPSLLKETIRNPVNISQEQKCISVCCIICTYSHDHSAFL